MDERIRERLHTNDITARTFHALALYIIQQGGKKAPEISNLENDTRARQALLLKAWQAQCAEKKAQAEKIALELRGQALVAFRRTIAEGNADAINAFVRETRLSPESALHFITSINEVESLSTAANAGAKVVFITAAAGRASEGAKTQALLERTET